MGIFPDFKFFVVGHESLPSVDWLQVTSFELQVKSKETKYKIQVTSFELQVKSKETKYKIQVTSFELQVSRQEKYFISVDRFQVASFEI